MARRWADRFDLPFDDRGHGYGHSSTRSTPCASSDLQLLVDYQEAVHRLTLAYVAGVDADELDRVVDEHWDPPVTAGVRLVSVIGDACSTSARRPTSRDCPVRRLSLRN